MKKAVFLLFIIFLYNYSIFSFKCGADLIKKKKKYKKIIPKRNKDKRGLSSEYTPIKIKVDYTYLESQKKLSSEILGNLKNIMEDVINHLSALLSVKHEEDLSTDEDEIDEYCDIPKVSSEIGSFYETYDLLIFPMIAKKMDEETNAAAWGCMYLKNDKPIAGVVEINKNLSFNKRDTNYYMKYLLMHELSHVLGFGSQTFEDLKMLETETVNGITKTYISTPKVLEKARIHFNCESIKGVPVENQGGDGSALSHWESRYMLGDYMISNDYPEMVISDITLAYFEDTGFYKANYYTGGLFRFGKNQGCAFLEEECVTNNGKSTSFPNEFCTEREAFFCGSSHLSRGDCYIIEYDDRLDSQFRHFNNKKLGGTSSADYCPVMNTYSDDDLDNKYEFPQNCKYGANLYGDVQEVIGDNSVCFETSLTSKSYDQYLDDTYSICYQIQCDKANKQFDVYIGNNVVTCPEERAILFNPKGFSGKIKCPGYHMVCTSEDANKWCNELLDCIDKRSLADLNTYKYINRNIKDGSNYENYENDEEDISINLNLNKFILLLEIIFVFLI